VEALLRDVYGEEASPEGMAAFLANFNADKDGVISWEVFAAALGDMENEDASAEADDMDPEATRDGGMAIYPDSVLLGGARASPPAGWIVAHEIDAGGEAASEGGEAWERLLSEAILAEARPRFGVLPLARRFNAELVFSCGAQPPLAWTGLESLELRGHVPTLWSVFIRAVRLKLQAELGPQWSVSTEWRVLQALYAEASARRACAGSSPPTQRGRRRSWARWCPSASGSSSAARARAASRKKWARGACRCFSMRAVALVSSLCTHDVVHEI